MHREVAEIRRKMLNAPWPKYLRSINIDGLRGWSGQEIRFEFPVAVIAGENGSGKSTVLKAVATTYQHPTDRSLTYYPGTFFPDTAWDAIQNATINYRIREGSSEREYSFRKSAERWRFRGGQRGTKRAQRHVILQDISRTLPLDATAGYAQIARRASREVEALNLSPALILYYSTILGRNYESARLARSSLNVLRDVGVVNWAGQEYSQFHQGAGEDATLDLLGALQQIPDTSLR